MGVCEMFAWAPGAAAETAQEAMGLGEAWLRKPARPPVTAEGSSLPWPAPFSEASPPQYFCLFGLQVVTESMGVSLHFQKNIQDYFNGSIFFPPKRLILF